MNFLFSKVSFDIGPFIIPKILFCFSKFSPLEKQLKMKVYKYKMDLIDLKENLVNNNKHDKKHTTIDAYTFASNTPSTPKFFILTKYIVSIKQIMTLIILNPVNWTAFPAVLRVIIIKFQIYPI